MLNMTATKTEKMYMIYTASLLQHVFVAKVEIHPATKQS